MTKHESLAHKLLNGSFCADGVDYIYFDDATRSIFRVDRSDLADLGRRLEDGETDAYSLWCGDTDAEEVVE